MRTSLRSAAVRSSSRRPLRTGRTKADSSTSTRRHTSRRRSRRPTAQALMPTSQTTSNKIAETFVVCKNTNAKKFFSRTITVSLTRQTSTCLPVADTSGFERCSLAELNASQVENMKNSFDPTRPQSSRIFRRNDGAPYSAKAWTRPEFQSDRISTKLYNESS